MDKKIFESLKQGLKEAEAFKKGNLSVEPITIKVKVPDVKEIRAATGLSQKDFAKLFGWPVDTVRSWEQGRRLPDHSAKMMLKLIDTDPQYVLDALRA